MWEIRSFMSFFEDFLPLFLNVLERLVLASLPRNIALHIIVVVVVKPKRRWARWLWWLLLLLLLLWWQPMVQPIPYLAHCNFFEDVKSQVFGIRIKELWAFQKRRWERIQSPIFFNFPFFHPPIISGGFWGKKKVFIFFFF